MRIKRPDGVTVIFLLSEYGVKISKSSPSPGLLSALEKVAPTLPALMPKERGVADLGDYGDVFYRTYMGEQE